MKTSRMLCLTFSLLSTPAALAATISLDNQTLWTLQEVAFSMPDDEAWGSNMLGDNILDSGAQQIIPAPARGTRDVRLINDEGASCVLRGMRFRDGKTWRISDDDLLDCETQNTP